MHGSRSRTCRPADRWAFSLVELLVTVGVIAVVAAIVVPSLGRARATAQNTVCYANLRALGTAWHAYVADKGHFPRTQRSIANAHIPELPPSAASWGGAQAAGNPNDPNYAALTKARPINAYVSAERLAKTLFEIFHCPLDEGGKTWSAYERRYRTIGENFEIEFYRFPELRETCYGNYGNSYYANDWVWAKVGSPDGGGPSGAPHWKFDNTTDAIINPSKTVMLGDMGGLYPGVFTDQQQRDLSIMIGWWHGHRTSNIVLWDGSVKRVTMKPGGSTDEYWMWLNPSEHEDWHTPLAGVPSATRWPGSSGGR